MRFRVFAAAAVLALVATSATQASVIYSGEVDIPVATTFDGTWLNLVTGSVQQNTVNGAAGWDVNVWVSGSAWRLFPNANGSNPDGGVLVSSGTSALTLAVGSVVGGAGTYSTSASVVPTTGVNVYGLRLYNEATSAIHYGWIRLDLATGPLTGKIADYAYESVANTAITFTEPSAVPEPGTIALTMAGLAGLLLSRIRGNRSAEPKA